jgi:hypothetical protein
MSDTDHSPYWDAVRSGLDHELCNLYGLRLSLADAPTHTWRCPHCGDWAYVNVWWRRSGVYIEWFCDSRKCARRGYMWRRRRPLIRRLIGKLRHEGITHDEIRRLGAVAAEVAFWLCYAAWMVSILAKLRR